MAAAVNDLRYADEILWGELAPQERHTWDPNLRREALHQSGFADARRTPNKHGTHDGNIEQELAQLILGKRNGCVHRVSTFSHCSASIEQRHLTFPRDILEVSEVAICRGRVFARRNLSSD